MDGLKRYVNDDRFRVDGDKNMRLLAFAFTIVFVWMGSKIIFNPILNASVIRQVTSALGQPDRAF